MHFSHIHILCIFVTFFLLISREPPENFEYVTPIIKTEILSRKCPSFQLLMPVLRSNLTIQRTPAFRYINIGSPTLQEREVHQNHLEVKSRRGRFCIKCPPEKILIASKFQDGILIDAPKIHSCSGHTLSPTQYTLETLFSPNFKFGLPQGMHSFIGRIRNVKTNDIEKVCSLKYKVVVQKCQKFHSPDINMRVFCDMVNIWGSKCRFGCRNNGKLSHNRPIYCNDDLKWSGDIPSCKYAKPSKYFFFFFEEKLYDLTFKMI